MKHNNSSESLNFGSQNPVGGSLSVLNLSEVVTGNIVNIHHITDAVVAAWILNVTLVVPKLTRSLSGKMFGSGFASKRCSCLGSLWLFML
ncbi:uncharacterized protein LOC131011858 isoform X3 [Salvia miltiorrhiza]|uniref:uncharacterized protein LOC131011858 isoform X3 n=1 Tax=Salvia miltiorrhiza TaxID=226208 RepID=UPI0025AC1C03|nr:uncharacterized protein LOC131011858 isoform X3 [Salvia miltiorrhiza]